MAPIAFADGYVASASLFACSSAARSFVLFPAFAAATAFSSSHRRRRGSVRPREATESQTKTSRAPRDPLTILCPVKVGLLALTCAMALSLGAAAASADAPPLHPMTLTCHVRPGATVVTGGIADRSHFRFQWWYANGTTYKAPVWVYYASASKNHGKAWIPTHGHPTRALATEHLASGALVRVRATCS